MEVLAGALKQDQTDAEMRIRLYASEEDPQRLEFGLDNERENDVVLSSASGSEVLVIENGLADKIDRLQLDFQESEQGPGFVLEPQQLDS